MDLIEDRIIEILAKIPSECACIDYKVVPYDKKKNHDVIRDVIAMLNSIEGINKDKYIIFGITDDKKYRGIDISNWKNDNEWQNLFEKIAPRPHISTGTIRYEEKEFGYFYLFPENVEWVYEVGETVIGEKEATLAEKNGAFKGQAFIRYGSVNRVMTNKERKWLNNVYVLEKQSVLADYQTSIPVSKCFIIAALVGSWNEDSSGDQTIISEFAGQNYGEFSNAIKSIYFSYGESFTLTDRVWKVKNHINILLILANRILDEHLEALFKIAVKVFSDVDPKYNLQQNERYAVALFPNVKQKKYSYSLLKGIAETIAFLGNNKDKFKNCSPQKLSHYIRNFENSIFSTKDWKVYATISDQFVCIGESCPDVFLDKLRCLLEERDESFITFLNEKSGSLFSSSPYGYQLKWILSILAREEKYFSRVMYVLMLLATIQESFINTLIDIIVPWYPQTHADVKSRVGVLRGLSREFPELTWKALMQLMPNVTSTVIPSQEPKFMQVEPLPKGANFLDYINATNGYIELACTLLNGNPNKMAALLNILETVPNDTQEKIIQAIQNDVNCLEGKDKECFWNKIQDFIAHQVRLKGSGRALSQEILKKVEELTKGILSDVEDIKARRLFIKEQYTLVAGNNDLVKERQELFVKQKEVIKKIYDKNGKAGVNDFASDVEYPALVGRCAANVFNDEDLKYVIKNDNSVFDSEVVGSIVRELTLEKLKALVSDFSDFEKAIVFSKLWLTDSVVQETEVLEEKASELFWMRVDSFCSELKIMNSLQIAIDNLNKVMRPEASLEILHDRLTTDNDIIPVNLAIVVLDACTKLETIDQTQVYYLRDIIKWLQNQNITSEQKALFEWKYCYVLDGYSGFEPIYLFHQMSTDADFYAEIIKKSREKLTGDTGNDLANNKAFQIQFYCHRLLRNWKIIPGLQSDGFVDAVYLDNWIDNVKKAVGEKHLLAVAMYYLGRCFFHAPVDRTGFFIDRAVATVLQDDKRGDLKSGYYDAACYGQEAQFVDYMGETDFKIESSYNEKAKAAEMEGFYNLAALLRKIAEYYHNEGEQNKREGQALRDQ